jgi:hypothetical protein
LLSRVYADNRDRTIKKIFFPILLLQSCPLLLTCGCGSSPKVPPAKVPPPNPTVANPLPVVFLKRGERRELALAKAAAQARAQTISFESMASEAGGGEGTQSDASSPTPPHSPRWSILLGTFTGPQADASVARARAFLEGQGLGAGLRVEPMRDVAGGGRSDGNGGRVLMSGLYAGPQEAQADLARFKALDAGGGAMPFASAMLTPLEARAGARGGGGEGAIGERGSEYDLRSAARAAGSRALYTLQVGVYRMMDATPPSGQDLASFRRAAEEAARTLRQGGAEAYVYHGPSSSTICVGLFGEEDVIVSERDPETGAIRTLPTPRYSPRLVVTQQEHPQNLVNGQGVKTKRAGEAQGRLQPSFLIRVPE